MHSIYISESRTATAMTNCFKKMLTEKRQILEESLKQAGDGGDVTIRLKDIATYKGKVLGMLYAYTMFDNLSEPKEILSIQELIHKQLLDPGAREREQARFYRWIYTYKIWNLLL